MSRTLFILKRREDFNTATHSHVGLSTGLYNSAKFMYDMLINHGLESKMVIVIDNNDIDREVTQYKPTHVVIEALWVVPSKFNILQKLHPDVKWIIRLHSEMPFMAGEGIAMDWVGDYLTYKNVVIACNAPRMLGEIKLYAKLIKKLSNNAINNKIIYLPNYYPQDYKIKEFNFDKDTIDIACFGAVRLLKNHLVQAFGALDFASSINKKLRFHINAGRIEMKGEPVMHNLQGLFQHLTSQGHQLVKHNWVPREKFISICAQMDIGLQVSFSETFNIVSADLISQGIPLVGSSEIPWLMDSTSNITNFTANPTDSKSISHALYYTYKYSTENVLQYQHSLTEYTSKTKDIWYKYFN